MSLVSPVFDRAFNKIIGYKGKVMSPYFARVLCSFTVPDEPVAQARGRFGKGHVYDPEKSRDHKQLVAQYARFDYKGEPTSGPVYLAVRIYRTIPKSWSKKKKKLALAGELLPTGKPDGSNYLKGIEDAMNGIVYKDDSQIVDFSCSKRWSDNPRTEIRVSELNTGGGEK